MITTLSKKITHFLISVSNTDPEPNQIEVYIYGLECFLNTGFTLLILFVWGLLTNTLLETCCWITVFSILRHHSGGLHAPTQFACIISSCLLGISNWLVIEFISYQTIRALCICIFCIVICFLYAPADTPKYELTASKRRKEKLFSVR